MGLFAQTIGKVGWGILPTLGFTAAAPLVFSGLGAAWKSGGGALAKGVFNLAKGSTGRLALGAGIGAISGFATSDKYDIDNRLHDTFRGAMIGAGIGAGVNIGISGTKFLGKGLGRAAIFRDQPFRPTDMDFISRGIFKGVGAARKISGGRALKLASNTALFAAEHPIAALGIAGGVWGGHKALGRLTRTDRFERSPTLSGVGVSAEYINQQSAIEDITGGTGSIGGGMVGIAPVMIDQYHRALEQSTYGLVQGMHRGRHS